MLFSTWNGITESKNVFRVPLVYYISVFTLEMSILKTINRKKPHYFLFKQNKMIHINTTQNIFRKGRNNYKLENLLNNLKNEPKKNQTFISSIYYLFQPKCHLTVNSTAQRVQTPYIVKLYLNVTTFIIHNNISSQDKCWAKHEIKSATHQMMA